MALAWPQRPGFAGNPFLQNQIPNQGFGSQGSFQNPQQGGFQSQPQGSGQFFPNQGFPNQGGQNQGFNNQAFPNQGFQNQFNPNNPFLPSSSPNPDITTISQQGIINPINPQGFQNPTQNQVISTTPAAAPSQSPAFLRCTREQCLATNEYNPVCGTDQVVYSNIRKLDCANQCGRRLMSNWQGNNRLFIIKIQLLLFLFTFFRPSIEVTVLRQGSCTSGQRVS